MLNVLSCLCLFTLQRRREAVEQLTRRQMARSEVCRAKLSSLETLLLDLLAVADILNEVTSGETLEALHCQVSRSRRGRSTAEVKAFA